MLIWYVLIGVSPMKDQMVVHENEVTGKQFEKKTELFLGRNVFDDAEC